MLAGEGRARVLVSRSRTDQRAEDVLTGGCAGRDRRKLTVNTWGGRTSLGNHPYASAAEKVDMVVNLKCWGFNDSRARRLAQTSLIQIFNSDTDSSNKFKLFFLRTCLSSLYLTCRIRAQKKELD